jgi:hypothetical protein
MPTTAVYSAAAMTATICYIAEDPHDELAGWPDILVGPARTEKLTIQHRRC